MTGFQRIVVAGLCLSLAAGAVIPMLRGAIPAATGPAAAVRTQEQVEKDLTAISVKLREIMPSLESIGDAQFRRSEGPKLSPLLRDMGKLLLELEALATLKEDKEDAQRARRLFLALGVALEDKDCRALLEAESKSGDASGVAAKSSLMIGQWIALSQDAAAQATALEAFTAVVKDNASNEDVAEALFLMANLGSANAEMSRKVTETARAHLKGASAAMVVAAMDRAQEQRAAESRQRESVGKAIALEGRTSTGGKFSTTQYKGKVVLVDFWATWCGPCIAELPNLKKIYATYHDKGLEIVGLSCDADDEVLNKFTRENEMTWVQLRESSQNEAEDWHPLARQWGVTGIPTMFLIDRHGVLRYVDARADLEKKVAELVAESVKPDATTAPAVQP